MTDSVCVSVEVMVLMLVVGKLEEEDGGKLEKDIGGKVEGEVVGSSSKHLK